LAMVPIHGVASRLMLDTWSLANAKGIDRNWGPMFRFFENIFAEKKDKKCRPFWVKYCYLLPNHNIGFQYNCEFFQRNLVKIAKIAILKWIVRKYLYVRLISISFTLCYDDRCRAWYK
jgi:hypothetical protein